MTGDKSKFVFSKWLGNYPKHLPHWVKVLSFSPTTLAIQWIHTRSAFGFCWFLYSWANAFLHHCLFCCGLGIVWPLQPLGWSHSQVQVLARPLERCLSWVLPSVGLDQRLWELIIYQMTGHPSCSPSYTFLPVLPHLWLVTVLVKALTRNPAYYQSPHSKQTASLSKLSIIRYSVPAAGNRLRPPYSTLWNQGNFIGVFFVFFFFPQIHDFAVLISFPLG